MNDSIALNALFEAAHQENLTNAIPSWSMLEPITELHEPEAKKKQLSPTSKCRLYNEVKIAQMADGKNRRNGQISAIAAKYNVSRKYPLWLVNHIDNGGCIEKKVGSGPVKTMLDE